MSYVDAPQTARSRLRQVGLLGLIVALGLCLVPGVADAAKGKKSKSDKIGVMTYNLYLGSDLNPAVAASQAGATAGPTDLAGNAAKVAALDNFANEVGFVVKDVDANNFNTRAIQIAKDIKNRKVDLIGLQEAALWQVQFPTDGGAASPANPTATRAHAVSYDYVQQLLQELNKKAKNKKQCGADAKKREAAGKKPKQCYRGYQLVKAQQEADIEFPGDFDNNPGPNGIGGNGPAFDTTPGGPGVGFPCIEAGGVCGGAASARPGPPCFNGFIDGTAGEAPNAAETNPGGDDTGAELGDPGPPNTTPVNDPTTGQPAPFDYNGDSSSNYANNGNTAGTQALSCGPDTLAGIFGATAPPYSYASDCPDTNPIAGVSLGPTDKTDVTSSCVFHGIDGDASLTMRDAILSRKGAGVKTSNVRSGNYTNGVSFTVAGTPVKFTRGWVATDAKVRGKSFTFANTHLESLDNGTVREDQATELLKILGSAPTVLVGDLNSDPASADPESPPAYNRFAAAGFSSLTGPAPTSGHAELLSDKSNTLAESRIDHILTNALTVIKAAGASQVVDSFANGLWNSDHGGVFVKIKGKKAK